MTVYAIGQDSHRFSEDSADSGKKLILGGVTVEGSPALKANSDGDVILHALTNAVSGVTCRPVLGPRADELCKAGITDSSVYLSLALSDLSSIGGNIIHISISVECLTPKINPISSEIRRNIASLCKISEDHVAVTATTGEHLTQAGSGYGISVFCAVTASVPQ